VLQEPQQPWRLIKWNIIKGTMAKSYWGGRGEDTNTMKKPQYSKHEFDSSLLMSNFYLECIVNNNKQKKTFLYHFRALLGKRRSLKFSNKRMSYVNKSSHTNATHSITSAPSPIVLI